MKRILAIAAVMSLTACAIAPAPGIMGNGHYKQTYNKDGRLLSEVDVLVGLTPCSSEASNDMRSYPGIVVKCAHAPSTDPLPYKTTIHIQTGMSDGYRPSSPFTVRWAEAASCKSYAESQRKRFKTVVLEESCGQVTPVIKSVQGEVPYAFSKEVMAACGNKIIAMTSDVYRSLKASSAPELKGLNDEDLGKNVAAFCKLVK